MHGFMTPLLEEERAPRQTTLTRVRDTVRRYRWFLGLVLAPTMLVGAYLYLFAADQYQSEAHFIVKSQSGQSSSSSSGLSALLGGGGSSSGAADTNTVADYLNSHDVVSWLQTHANLVAIFRRPEADAYSRLNKPDPTPEELLRFYQGQVTVVNDRDTGITNLAVRTFRPADSYMLATQLLRLGEQRVNELNARVYNDTVAVTRKQVAEVEAGLTDIQRRMTGFRQTQRDIDPQTTAESQIKLVSDLQAQLVAARAQLATTQRLIGTRNPQHEALAERVRVLEAQTSSQSGRLAGNGSAIAAGLGDYERLKLQQDFLAKRYDAVNAAYEAARQQAIRQQLYIVRTVDPNLPVKSTYPRRGVTTATVFVVLLLVYGIGWLLAAGIREHAA